MNQQLAMITLVVDDYDPAIEFFTQKLNFQLIEDTILSDVKRWVVVSPAGSFCKILLAKAANEAQSKSIGNQTGGRVFLFLHTDDVMRDLENLKRNEVKIVRGPTHEIYGTVAVFEDLYGNLWDLIQPVRK